MRQMPDLEGADFVDPLDSVPGLYQTMRQRLRDIGFGVLPHPSMGFGLPGDEIRATDALEKATRGKVSAHL